MLLYNTLARQKQLFEPADEEEVKIYACGPTVYDFSHLGHFRAYIFVDVLRRALRYNGYKVKHVMNITDVGHLTNDADAGDDKIRKTRANTLFIVCKKCKHSIPTYISIPKEALSSLTLKDNKVSCCYCNFINKYIKNDTFHLKGEECIWAIAKFFTDDFFDAMRQLNVEKPEIVCKATLHIAEMISLIRQIEKNGYAYKISDGIYFDTARLSDYGKLARLDIKSLQAGARVEPNPEKKNPTDFALWKFSPKEKDKKRQMEWDSPWGYGFPGWHIECTAMSTKYLGLNIDIHTGGIDHIPVHHTNEIAQAQGAFGKNIVKFWLHNEFIMIDGEKMSKSKKNFFRLTDITKRGIAPLSLRYLFLQAHYRTPVNFTWVGLKSADRGLANLYDLIKSQKSKIKSQICKLKVKSDNKYKKLFFEAINDDLNTAKGLAILQQVLRDIKISAEEKLALVFDFDQVLGLGLADLETQKTVAVSPEIKKLIQERELARQNKNFALADKLRQKIESDGFIIEDTDQGVTIKINSKLKNLKRKTAT